ncbi:MAG TPA: FHA domain-containing protein [Solirubrobacterales bacterium]|jgi:predicted  nucleic acid-binding Zn-ribbon protein
MSIAPERVGESRETATRQVHAAGEPAAAQLGGSLKCVECGYAINVLPEEEIPECPACGGTEFRRASLFDRPTMETAVVEPAPREPTAIASARAQLPSGYHLAWEGEDGELVTFALQPGWVRIGRSGSADLRLDDPTVSRRHALIVLTEEGEVRALDDRSLNGLFVNGRRVEWARLSDGDEIEIGCFRLYLLEA